MRDGLLDDGFGVVERGGCEFELGLRRRGSGSSSSSGGGRPRCSGCWGFWGKLPPRDEWCARRDGSGGAERQWRGMRWYRLLLRHRGQRRRRRLHRRHEQMRQSVDEREPPLLRQPREIQALQSPKKLNQRAELGVSLPSLSLLCVSARGSQNCYSPQPSVPPPSKTPSPASSSRAPPRSLPPPPLLQKIHHPACLRHLHRP